jgi:hypothetical protein
MPACVGEWAEYCVTAGHCLDYDAQVAHERGQRGTATCYDTRLGTCGALRFVLIGRGYTSTVRYYDSAGSLVSVHKTSDTTSFCGGTAFAQDYGSVPSCTRTVTESICP